MSDENNQQNKDSSEEDIIMDDDIELSLEDSALDFQDKVKKLKSKLKDITKEKEEYLNGWQRCRADFVNAKKATERDRTGLMETITESLVKDLLPVLDSFDLAFQNNGGTNTAPEVWRQGFSGIYSKMLDALQRYGLRQIGEIGEKFDIKKHQPVAMMDVGEEGLDDTVTEVFQKGYMVNERVIRPAKVKVGQFRKSE
ncbi:MAG: nucleotide exchange factor GrpE [Candidatus Vogelbacteria bacterium]|nr:nucleotide exchange factor GrpE [Candidatus Vogelbacteria bacterium]